MKFSGVLKFLLAVALFPSAALCAVAAVKGFYSILAAIHNTLFFCAGVAVYMAVHMLLGGAGRVYIFAHELAHALAGLMCGFKIKKFAAGARDGYVTMDGTNAFVALAPYCVPVYAIFCALGFYAASLKWDMSPYGSWFVGALGFLLCFHIVNTIEILWAAKQSDLRQAGGVFFSCAVITAANGIVMLAAFKLLYPEMISFRDSGVFVAQNTACFWRWTGLHAAALCRGAYAYALQIYTARAQMK